MLLYGGGGIFVALPVVIPIPQPRTSVVIPAHNEAGARALVLAEIPAGLAREGIKANNSSADNTGTTAAANGATVRCAPRSSPSYASLTGMVHAFGRPQSERPNVVVFLDGDHSNYPEPMPELLAPLLRGPADMVIGSQALGVREKGFLRPQQQCSNGLAVRLLRLCYGGITTDSGPFRAILAPCPAGHRQGRQNLRLDGGRARVLPQVHWPQQGIGHGARHPWGRPQHSVRNF